MDIYSTVWFYYKDSNFPFKNETQHYSNDCHGWPYGTPFNQPNFSVHFRLFGQKVNNNNRNCCIWGSENPNVIIEKPMHPQRVTVWCGFWYGGIIGPFLLENEQGAAFTVNGERYRFMLNKFSFPKIKDDMNNWSPRDCDLTPLNYFLWGLLRISVTLTIQRRLRP